MPGRKSRRRRRQPTTDVVKPRIINLPPAPPDFYLRSVTFRCYLRSPGVTTGSVVVDPYALLNHNNSALLLKCQSVRVLHLDFYLVGNKAIKVSFYDSKSIQSTQSGSPLLLGWGSKDADRHLVLAMGNSLVTRRRIPFPRHITDMSFDVTDKVTPLVQVEGATETSGSVVFVYCELTLDPQINTFFTAQALVGCLETSI